MVITCQSVYLWTIFYTLISLTSISLLCTFLTLIFSDFYDHSALMFWSFDILMLLLIFRTLWFLSNRWNFILGFLLKWSFSSTMGHPIHWYYCCNSELGDSSRHLKSIQKFLDFQMFWIFNFNFWNFISDFLQ